MLKAQKIEYVKKLKQEIKEYKTIGVMPLESIPDRLLQRIRNQLRSDTKVVIARRNLLLKAVEGDANLSKLADYITGDSALILSNKEPLDLYSSISSNKLKLAAKPNQIAIDSISIEAGETAIPPGQGVTDLKAAGIDVQIQKGKVIISKGKVLVQKGAKISTAVSKALRMLDITPFEVAPTLKGALSEGVLFNSEVLSINSESVSKDIAVAFAGAYALTLDMGYVTEFNVGALIKKAYLGALGLGIMTKAYEPGVVEMLIANAVAEALNIKAAEDNTK
ncbi:MAG: 50S ribosomal protein L10 [Candidatus Micrarchaeia archaeon]